MKKHFYTHLITLEDLHAEIALLPMPVAEKEELVIIIHETIHHVVVDTMLSEFDEEDKHVFLHHITQDNHDDIWVLLNTKVKDAEEKITQAVYLLKKELLNDITEVTSEHVE